jgi:predicted nucleotidyltransferase component of viral defense system
MIQIEKNREKLKELITVISGEIKFPPLMTEKDYYLTALLSGINSELDDNLVFKGGTCLSKMYFDYFRLSEDLDFIMLLPEGKPTRSIRSGRMEKVKSKIQKYASGFGLRFDEGFKNGGRNESKQYNYRFVYDSVINPEPGSVKLEISLRFNPLLPVKKETIGHKFIEPFSRKPVFNAGTIKCIQIEEAAAEKLRAAVSRKTPAPRDFFDLAYFIKTGFDFRKKGFMDMYGIKLKEDGVKAGVKKSLKNLNRTDDEIKGMKSRLEGELLGVLSSEAARGFDMDAVFKYFNNLADEA